MIHIIRGADNNMQKNSNIKDLTVGKPMSLIMGFAVSLLWGMLFQQLYIFGDPAVIDHIDISISVR